MALLDGFFGDGLSWHDTKCNDRLVALLLALYSFIYKTVLDAILHKQKFTYLARPVAYLDINNILCVGGGGAVGKGRGVTFLLLEI